MGISFQRQERREDLFHSADNYGIQKRNQESAQNFRAHSDKSTGSSDKKTREPSSRSERGCLQWLSQ